LAEWTISIYFVGFAFGVLFWGRVSDFIGRRPAMLWGLVIYTVGCIGCLISKEINCLLISRFIQAFGASTGSVISQTMLRDVLDNKVRGKIFSIVGMVFSISPAIGPLIGGYATSYYGWSSAFYILFFIGIIFLVCSYIYLPETRIPGSKQQIESFFLTAKRLFQDKMVLGLCYIVGAINGIIFSFYAEAPFIFINILKVPAEHYGLIGLVISLSYIIGSETSRRLNHNKSPKSIIKLGCWVMFLGATMLMLAGYMGMIAYEKGNLAYIAIGFPLLIIFTGIGITIPNALSIALDNHKHVLGTAGSIFGFSYYVIISLLTFIMGKIHNGTSLPIVIYFLVLSISMVVVYYAVIRESD
jgi:Bcr/CflA subfamily drug resistance transporter